MRRTSSQEVVAVNEVIVSLVCDCCGAECHGPNEFRPNWSDEWGGTKTANLYTDKSDGEWEEIDLCFDCGQWLMGQIKAKYIQRKRVQP